MPVIIMTAQALKKENHHGKYYRVAVVETEPGYTPKRIPTRDTGIKARAWILREWPAVKGAVEPDDENPSQFTLAMEEARKFVANYSEG